MNRLRSIADLVSMEQMFALFIRGGMGFLFGFFIGIVAMMLTFWTYPGTAPIWLLVFTVGIGASFATFLSFLKPEVPNRVMAIGLGISLVGGIVGSWLGFFYAEVVYPDGIRNVYFISYGTVRSPAVVAFVMGAAIVSTITGSIYYAFRLFRYHEV